jgi:hypothetical protein
MARPKEAAVLGLEHFSSSEADENKGGTADGHIHQLYRSSFSWPTE